MFIGYLTESQEASPSDFKGCKTVDIVYGMWYSGSNPSEDVLGDRESVFPLLKEGTASAFD